MTADKLTGTRMRRSVIAPKYVFLVTAVLLLHSPPARADSVPCDPASALVLSAGYVSGSRPRGLAVVDLNGDGLLDVAVANSNFNPISGDSSSLSIHLAIGGARFAPPTRYRVDDQAFHVVAGDFDLDGYVDLVTANYATNSVSLFRGVGDHGKPTGTFLPPAGFAAGSGPSFALQRDFNGDGRLDLAVLNSTTGSLSILLGRIDGSGQATFTPPVTYVLGDSRSSPGTAASADFNGDGIADLVVTLYNSHRIAMLPGTGAAGSGDGGFGAPVFIDVPDFPWTIIARDLNGDGICDLAVTGVGWLTIVRGRGAGGHGNGTFMAPVSYASQFITQGTLSMAAGDFNRDGIVDFVASFSYVGRMAMFPGRGANGVGDGTFATPRVADAPSFAVLAGSDVSGDSHPDLLALF